jgi:hypothetical protein
VWPAGRQPGRLAQPLAVRPLRMFKEHSTERFNRSSKTIYFFSFFFVTLMEHNPDYSGSETEEEDSVVQRQRLKSVPVLPSKPSNQKENKNWNAKRE